MANAEWAAGQSWGNEICVAYRDIKRQNEYNHAHTATSIKEIKRAMAVADEERDRRKAKVPGEMADMVSQGMESLAQLVHTPPASIKESEPYSIKSEIECAHAADSSTSGEETKRGRRCITKRRPRRRSPSPSPSTSRSPSPPDRRRSSRRSTSKNKTKPKKKEKKEKGNNPTGCKYCKKYGGNGNAHAPITSVFLALLAPRRIISLFLFLFLLGLCFVF